MAHTRSVNTVLTRNEHLALRRRYREDLANHVNQLDRAALNGIYVDLLSCAELAPILRLDNRINPLDERAMPDRFAGFTLNLGNRAPHWVNGAWYIETAVHADSRIEKLGTYAATAYSFTVLKETPTHQDFNGTSDYHILVQWL